MGRSRALMFTILTYATFTGMSYFAHAWWHLMIFRFLAALGIGGEWAVGASILSETWPSRWRPWIAAVLQTGVNIGNLLATALASLILLSWLKFDDRVVFLVGILPALLVLWIRHAVPEPEEWKAAKQNAAAEQPRFVHLFQGPVRRITVDSHSGVRHVAFRALGIHVLVSAAAAAICPTCKRGPTAQRNGLASTGLALVMVHVDHRQFSGAGYLARLFGYRRGDVVYVPGILHLHDGHVFGGPESSSRCCGG